MIQRAPTSNEGKNRIASPSRVQVELQLARRVSVLAGLPPQVKVTFLSSSPEPAERVAYA